MIAGTLVRLSAAVPQTFSYLAYFIHLREYAEKVVAREWTFSCALESPREPIRVPIEAEIDLHAFEPHNAASVVAESIAAAATAGFTEVPISPRSTVRRHH